MSPACRGEKAQHELHVLGRDERKAVQRELRERHRQVRDREARIAEQAEVEHRVGGAPLPPDEEDEQHGSCRDQADVGEVESGFTRLDHARDDEADPDGPQHGAGHVRGRRGRVA